jgi:hypothetical protein
MPLGTLDAIHLCTALIWRDRMGPLTDSPRRPSERARPIDGALTPAEDGCAVFLCHPARFNELHRLTTNAHDATGVDTSRIPVEPDPRHVITRQNRRAQP